MSEALDPSEAAAIAEGADLEGGDAGGGAGDDLQEGAGDPMPEEGGGGLFGSLQEALLSTEPDTPLAAVNDPWDPVNGGETRIYRGIQKMTNINGMPAILDVAIGAIEMAVDDDRADAGDGAGGGDDLPVPVGDPSE